jgi:hypothetical protein
MLRDGVVYLFLQLPPWPDAIAPKGEHFVFSHQAKGLIKVNLQTEENKDADS